MSSLSGGETRREALHRMIRVDHAGEYGAARIYAGQLAVLGRGATGDVLRHLRDQEQAHLDRFNELVADRRVRTTALMPLWHVAGYVLGAATAVLGEQAAMACTVAVEEVIDRHYTNQIDDLGDTETPLRETLEKIRGDEREHRDIARDHGAEQAPGYRLLSAAIRAGCRVAIRLSERL